MTDDFLLTPVQFGPFVPDYAVLYSFSRQLNQAVDSEIKPMLDSINSIRVPEDYATQRENAG